MAKLKFTAEELSAYFTGQTKHKAYNETVNITTKYRYHADGIYPKEMVEERRPSESLAVKNYRQKIFKAITKPTWGKVIIELNKIRRSPDWAPRYDPTKIPPRVQEKESLEQFCEKDYPGEFTSVTNWVFSVLLPQYLKDPNTVIAVMPKQVKTVVTELPVPFAYIFDSWNVIDFVQGDYAVLKSTDKSIYTDETGKRHYGNTFYIITTTHYYKYQETEKSGYRLSWEYAHNMNQLPVFRVKSVFHAVYDDTYVFKSRLDGMLERLDEALREYTDLQAEVVQHVFSEKWETIIDDCPTCKGSGEVKGAGFTATKHKCETCDGTGAKPRGPFATHKIRPPMPGESPIPTPPVGYVQKNVEIVKIQDERVDKHEFKALAAVNMEYLAKTPLNQSGLAKEVDRDGLTTFVHSVGEDLVWIMDKVYYFANEIRYFVYVADEEKRRGMLPYIPVPEKFDLLNSNYLEDQVSKQKENGGNPIIINALEEEYVNKKFAYNDRTREIVLASIRLDPLAGMPEDDKASKLSQGGITLETYILSSNIQEFIDRAIDEKTEDVFFKMKPKEQKELLRSYAKEQESAGNQGKNLLKTLFPGESQKDDETEEIDLGG